MDDEANYQILLMDSIENIDNVELPMKQKRAYEILVNDYNNFIAYYNHEISNINEFNRALDSGKEVKRLLNECFNVVTVSKFLCHNLIHYSRDTVIANHLSYLIRYSRKKYPDITVNSDDLKEIRKILRAKYKQLRSEGLGKVIRERNPIVQEDLCRLMHALPSSHPQYYQFQTIMSLLATSALRIECALNLELVDIIDIWERDNDKDDYIKLLASKNMVEKFNENIGSTQYTPANHTEVIVNNLNLITKESISLDDIRAPAKTDTFMKLLFRNLKGEVRGDSKMILGFGGGLHEPIRTNDFYILSLIILQEDLDLIG